MTDLGRGSGSEPWHPGDPLYGDPDRAARDTPAGSWDQYGAPRQSPQAQQPPQPAPPRPEYPQQGDPGAWAASAGPEGPYGAGPGDPYPAPPSGAYPAGDAYGGADPYAGADPYMGQGGYPAQARYPAPDPYERQRPGGQDPCVQPAPGQDPYGQDPYVQPAPGQDPYGQDSYGQDPPGQDPYGHDPYGRDPCGQDPYGHDPYDQSPSGQDPYGRDPYGRNPPGQDPRGQDPRGQDPLPPGPHGGDTHAPGPYGQPEGFGAPGPGHPGAGGGPPGPGPGGYGDPGHDPRDPYAQAHRQEPHAAPHHDGQNTGRRRRPQPATAPGDAPETGAGGDPHPFFADGGDGGGDARDGYDDGGYDEPPGRGDRGRRKGRKQGRAGRSGVACLVVLVVLGGGVGAVTWYGYNLYQDNFGAAPDYSGGGRGSVQVEIPKGAFSADIAKILFDNGVIKSAQAFVDAARADDEAARSIQPGVYTLKKEMSAADALKVLTDTRNLNTLIVAEGLRATQVYAAIDAKLGLKKGTTQKAAKDADLGLPKMAKGNPEGFLYPSRYSVGDSTKPVDLLKQMVKQAEAEYQRDDLDEAAKGVGRSPYEVIVIASVIQAEAQAEKDFGKVSRVIYNRLNTDATLGRLDMDSTINYALGRSTLDTSKVDTGIDHPYNTYRIKGLPPGPIGNPGHQAIKAALNPTDGDWVYFVTVKAGDTRFTADINEHNRNVQEFNRNQREGKSG